MNKRRRLMIGDHLRIGDTIDFDYTGTVQSVDLPAGKYKFECWGAQGGSNALDSSSGITTKYKGGEGGYSWGIASLSEPTTIYAFVGGQGPESGNGGWNCGGGGVGTYQSSDLEYCSKYGCGGGATDFSTVSSAMDYSSYRNNRSQESLLSRFIVAGGGSGAAAASKKNDQGEITYPTRPFYTGNLVYLGYAVVDSNKISGGDYIKFYADYAALVNDISVYICEKSNPDNRTLFFSGPPTSGSNSGTIYWIFRVPLAYDNLTQCLSISYLSAMSSSDGKLFYLYKGEQNTSVTFDLYNLVGYCGGGINGCGYNSTYYGLQNKAGANGQFGFGGNQTNKRYNSGCGGAGWYGGGCSSSTAYTYMRYSGGGSGFVNISENSQYLPENYTGLSLIDGSTIDGTNSFRSPSGATETGHSGNGFARITVLNPNEQSVIVY